MITLQNYNTEISRVNFDTLPPALRKTHENLMTKSPEKFYGKNEAITRVVDLYLKQLNESVQGTAKLRPGYERITLEEAIANISDWDIFEFDTTTGEMDEIKTIKNAENAVTIRNKQIVVKVNSKPSKAVKSRRQEAGGRKQKEKRKPSEFKKGDTLYTNAFNGEYEKGKVIKVNAVNHADGEFSHWSYVVKTASGNTSGKFDMFKTQNPEPRTQNNENPAKNPAPVRTKKSTKAKRTPARKPVAKKPKTQPPNNPTTVRKIKSPDLMVLTRIRNMGKKRQKADSLHRFVKQMENALAAGKYHDHRALIAELHGKLAKMLTTTAKDYEVNLSADTLATVTKAVEGAKERLRVSFLAGLPEASAKFRYSIEGEENGDTYSLRQIKLSNQKDVTQEDINRLKALKVGESTPVGMLHFKRVTGKK